MAPQGSGLAQEGQVVVGEDAAEVGHKGKGYKGPKGYKGQVAENRAVCPLYPLCPLYPSRFYTTTRTAPASSRTSTLRTLAS